MSITNGLKLESWYCTNINNEEKLLQKHYQQILWSLALLFVIKWHNKGMEYTDIIMYYTASDLNTLLHFTWIVNVKVKEIKKIPASLYISLIHTNKH